MGLSINSLLTDFDHGRKKATLAALKYENQAAFPCVPHRLHSCRVGHCVRLGLRHRHHLD